MSFIDTPKKLPSVDRLLNDPQVTRLVSEFGAPQITQSVKNVLQQARSDILNGVSIDSDTLIDNVDADLARLHKISLQRVVNLTGTVLHTNLGRAALPESAIAAMSEVARSASSLEFDVTTGKRGDRHQHAEELLCRLTGAERAIVVNNNAAAVMLTLNSLALRKQVPVSRGELIEIGGAFRMPDIMARAGCKLIEVGTTNRTHAVDFEEAINTKTALLMKVHTSNYAVQGFTSQVSEAALAKVANENEIPLVTDLGSGTLINLEEFGLPHEPTVREALSAGAHLVTFSGDKLLGGPQAGVIAGRRELVETIKKNPMTRAMRPDKVTIAALCEVLRLYSNPDKLLKELPTLRQLTRDVNEIEQLANRLAPIVQKHCPRFKVSVCRTLSQVGSGAMPVDQLESAGLQFTLPGTRRSGKALMNLALAFRELPLPVIGRIAENALIFDLRCLEQEVEFVDNLGALKLQ
ncbi:MAG: L-seryl-tRNA(Sec) selenium transferase [Acidiferrobacterales bacterium]|nr:L-seryl-tRNA(Sec) selenium transferase [Acidiferrobacterales bacterium]